MDDLWTFGPLDQGLLVIRGLYGEARATCLCLVCNLYARTTYAQRTHRVRTAYAPRTRRVRTAYAPRTQCVRGAYMPWEGSLVAIIVGRQCVANLYALRTHRVRTEYAPSTHRVRTAYAVRTQCVRVAHMGLRLHSCTHGTPPTSSTSFLFNIATPRTFL